MTDAVATITATGEVIDAGPQVHWEEAHGLPMSMQLAMATLYSDDGGRVLTITRSCYKGSTRNLTLLEGKPGGDLQHFAPVAETYRGSFTPEERNGQWGLWRPDGSGIISCAGRSFAWDEGPTLQLHGEVLGRATRTAFLGGTAPMVTTTRPIRVSGTVNGTAVSGLLLHCSTHMPADMSLVPSPYIDELQIVWALFINELEDGTVQSGDLYYGTGGFHHLVIARGDAPPLCTTDFSATTETDGGDPEFLRRVIFDATDETWIWEPDGDGGRWPLRFDLPEGHRIRNGVIRQRGDERPVRSALAFAETYLPRLRA